MKHIIIYEHGVPEVMRYEDAPIPEPGAGQVRLKVEAIGVNYIDTYQRSGAYKVPLPFVLGQEAAGVVDAVGDGVTAFQVGDRAGFGFGVTGAYSEYVIAPAEKLIPIPDGTSTRLAAAAMLQGMTAHYLTHSTFPLHAGHTALIHAAAGGTGQLVVQMAKRRGARVIATAGSPEKVKIAESLGADAVINYSTQDFVAEVKRLTDGAGVDVVYDSVGAATWEGSLDCLKRRGMMVLFGQSSGSVPLFDPQILNAKGSLYLTRPSLAAHTATRPELLERANDVFSWIADGSLHISVGHEFPLAQAA
ncbi:MAG: NADPH:quinone reductase, partial [Phototrophicales bacterium]